MSEVKSYDYVIIGSGISGLSLSVMLALNGKSVIVIEKSAKLGGSLRRFKIKDGNFDTGFHFTGGLNKNELFNEMLNLIGIDKKIISKAKPLKVKYFFEESKKDYDCPIGINNFENFLQKNFCEESNGIGEYFNYFKDIFVKTKMNDFKNLLSQSIFDFYLDEDKISLESILNKYIKNPILKKILASPSLCYGTSPKNISFANHVRASYYFYESLSFIEGGGETIFKAFYDKAKKLNVTFLKNAYPVEYEKSIANTLKTLILNNNQKISFQNIVFTIHPKEILSSLGEDNVKPSQAERINSFESSIGFFTLFGKYKSGFSNDKMLIFMNDKDINNDFDEPLNKDGSLCLIPNESSFCILESMHPSKMNSFINDKISKRSIEYKEYKKLKSVDILKRIVNTYKEFQDNFDIRAISTPLTYKDYLNNYDGSSYGVKQGMGQYNIFGRIGIKNVFVCGQSSILPGVLGSFFSSLLLLKQLLGHENFYSFIGKK